MAGIEQIDMATTDPEQLARIFNSLENPSEEETKPAAEAAATTDEKATTEQQPEKQELSETEEDQEAKAAGVASKDGKQIIPYSVLRTARDQRIRAEQLAQEAEQRVKDLEAQLQAVNQGAKQGEGARTNQQPDVNDLSQDDLEALKEDFPTVYKAVMASMAAAKALEAKLQPVENSVRNAEAEQARSVADAVQEAIDSVPKMAHIQATDAETFELAKQFDSALRNRPAWADKPLSERFAKVIEMVEAANGPIDLPNAKPASQASAEDLRKAAIAKASNAAKATRTNVPASLSEFPVGQHAAQDEREAVEQLTQLQLAEKFSRMTPDQMDAYFSEL